MAAPPFAFFEGWARCSQFPTSHPLDARPEDSCDFPDPELSFLLFVHQHRATLIASVVAKAAPRPLLRFEHESARDRIAMHVAQFLNPLRFSEDYEVIKTALPNMPFHQGCIPQAALSRVVVSTKFSLQAARKALFERLHDDGWVGSFRLAD